MPRSGVDMNTVAQNQTLSIDVLAQRVSNIEQAIGNLGSQLSLLNDRMTASGRTQWPVLMSFLGTLIVIVGGAWALASRPINTENMRQTEDIRTLSATIGKIGESIAIIPQTYLSREEYADIRLLARQDSDNRFRGIAEEIAAVHAEVKENRDMIVPRGEHEEHWRSQAAQVEAARQERLVQIESLQRQINEVQEGLGGIYGARDVIRDLQEQVQRLTAQVMSMSGRAVP